MAVGVIFDIQRFSIHDGSGIRTLVFMKGCLLRCLWCCNPESQSLRLELMLLNERCIGCGRCLTVCPNNVVVRSCDGVLATDRSRCQVCGVCVRSCPANARVLTGRTVNADEVLNEVEKDAVFYRTSGGGVTVSGGEPLLQASFVEELLQACWERGIDTAIETCGYAAWDDFALVLPYTNAVLFDIKHIDPSAHRRLTGVDNRLILANLARVVESGVRVVVRVPLIPGCNTDADTIRGIAVLVRDLSIAEIHLLPYHRLGESKYRALGRSYPLNGAATISDDVITSLAEVAKQSSRATVLIGG